MCAPLYCGKDWMAEIKTEKSRGRKKRTKFLRKKKSWCRKLGKRHGDGVDPNKGELVCKFDSLHLM